MKSIGAQGWVLPSAILGLVLAVPAHSFSQDEVKAESAAESAERAPDSIGEVSVTLKVKVRPRRVADNPLGTAVYRLSRVGGTCSRLCVPPTSFAGSFDLSRDGKAIAYDGWQVHQGERPSDSRLYVFELATPSQIKDIGAGAMPSWSADGKRLAFSQYHSGRGVGIMNADGTERRIIDPAGWSAEWSPCGDKIAYTAFLGGSGNLVVYDLTTEETTPLFTTDDISFIKWGFAWSPDSKRLCGVARDKKGQQLLVVVHVQGEYRERRVISRHIPRELMASIDTPVAWGGDGSNIIFYARCPETKFVRLYLLDVAGDSPPVELPGQPKGMHCRQPYWLWDGTIIFGGNPKGKRVDELL